jgi:hypothetical protein
MEYIIANGSKVIECVDATEVIADEMIYYTSIGKSYIRSQFKTLDELCEELKFQKKCPESIFKYTYSLN